MKEGACDHCPGYFSAPLPIFLSIRDEWSSICWTTICVGRSRFLLLAAALICICVGHAGEIRQLIWWWNQVLGGRVLRHVTLGASWLAPLMTTLETRLISISQIRGMPLGGRGQQCQQCQRCHLLQWIIRANSAHWLRPLIDAHMQHFCCCCFGLGWFESVNADMQMKLNVSFVSFDREEDCYRCLFIVQKHANVLQYKECKYCVFMNDTVPFFPQLWAETEFEWHLVHEFTFYYKVPIKSLAGSHGKCWQIEGGEGETVWGFTDVKGLCAPSVMRWGNHQGHDG